MCGTQPPLAHSNPVLPSVLHLKILISTIKMDPLSELEQNYLAIPVPKSGCCSELEHGIEFSFSQHPHPTHTPVFFCFFFPKNRRGSTTIRSSTHIMLFLRLFCFLNPLCGHNEIGNNYQHEGRTNGLIKLVKNVACIKLKIVNTDIQLVIIGSVIDSIKTNID